LTVSFLSLFVIKSVLKAQLIVLID